MRFRPCIDIHGGKVKQIVGGTLNDVTGTAAENFVSDCGAEFYAKLYKKHGLDGGHVILLDKAGTEEYDKDLEQAEAALAAYPGGLQTGGGINDANAEKFIESGASHVIVTSYIFKDGQILFDNLNKLVSAVGKEHIVIDLSCRRKNGKYYVVTDRWQKFTDTEVTAENIYMLSAYCDEFLIHAADVEGKAAGIEQDIVSLLGSLDGIRSVYAGGIGSYDDIELIRTLGRGKVDFTVGSALDIFGGSIPFEKAAGISP